MKILFLGAGKRYSLMQRFLQAAEKENIDLELWSMESSVVVPISNLANIVIGPKFDEPSFEQELKSLCVNSEIDLVIPMMDSATVSLSRMSIGLLTRGICPIVSSYRLCANMEDKLFADMWFRTRNIPVPENTGFPYIAKERCGFGSRGQAVLNTEAEFFSFFSTRDINKYLVQSYLENAKEYTVDAYVTAHNDVQGVFVRERLEVESGEVMKSRSVQDEEIDYLARKVLANHGWFGPITLQFMRSELGTFLIEVNPRFGGGVIHAINSGLDIPRWIMQEHRGKELEPTPEWKPSTMVRYRSEVFL